MVVMLKRCCCQGCSLKTGAIIIGVSGIVYGIAMIIEYLYVMPSTYSELKYKWSFDVQLMSYITLCLGLLTLLINCILIVGVCTESKGPLLAWTIFTAVVTVLGMALCPLTVEIYFWDNNVNLAIIILCSGFTNLSIYTTYWWCTASTARLEIRQWMMSKLYDRGISYPLLQQTIG
ncbi:uncharacterized protein LOC124798739 [Schistocerca piceifrons]|uniref:uncharacterized protein LOC124798739 n=1 Tax=Schistocerca piceifrons TaxID=274613 RepID=UPI001F5F2E8A|nr:uncharacterized protein LOC124798739 [Schistocerca piceifrons]